MNVPSVSEELDTPRNIGRHIVEVFFGFCVLAIVPPPLLEFAALWAWKIGVAVFVVFLLLSPVRKGVTRLKVPFLSAKIGPLAFALIGALYFFSMALAIVILQSTLNSWLYSKDIGRLIADTYSQSWERYDPTWNRSVTATLPNKTNKATSTAVSETQAMVTEVVTGDRFIIMINGAQTTVRLIGAVAPEPGQPLSKESRDLLAGLVLNKNVTLVSDRTDKNENSELLRYVYSDEIFVNSELIRVGLAMFKSDPGNQEYDYLFSELSEQAKTKKLGLWSDTYAKDDKAVKVEPKSDNKLDPAVEPRSSIF